MAVWRKLAGTAMAAAALGLASAAAGQSKAPLKPETLLNWSFVGDPQIAPDGRRVAYVVTRSADEGTKYAGDVWLAQPGEAPRALTTHPANDRTPRWSPDGRRLAFLSNRSGKSQVWILEAQGEPWQLTDSKTDISGYEWSPDGGRIAFVANPPKPEEKPGEKSKAPVMLTTERLVFRNDGTPGWKSDEINQIWVVSLPAAPAATAARQITTDAFPHEGLAWAPDGRTIYFSTNDTPDPDYSYFDSEILAVAADGSGKPKRVTNRRGPDTDPAVSPDGKWLAYFGSDIGERMKAYEPEVLYVRNLSSGEVRPVQLPHGAGDGMALDAFAPKLPTNNLAWSHDGRSIYFTAAWHGRVRLYRTDSRTLKTTPVEGLAEGHIHSFTLGGGDRVAAVYSTQTAPDDVWLMDGKAPQRLTGHGQANVAPVTLGQPSEHWVPSFDGTRIQYWIIRPPNFDPRRKHPAILYIHGGPHSMYGQGFFHEFQTLANAGYVVIYGNPRGSTGYGGEFGNIIQHKYPGDDAKDLMATVDDAIRMGFVDPERLGVAGGSGGGVLSSWLIGTYPDRFKAAVVERAVLNWASMIGTDISLNMATVWFEDYPWRNPEPYFRRSSISLVEKVKTPALIIHNAEDYRVPVQQAYEYYTSLKLLKKPARLVVFPNSSHGMSRDGTPEQRVARLKLITDWFDGYLKK
jgi:dipeptidyl aminopeptidase/acylaminoacyl peptidase